MGASGGIWGCGGFGACAGFEGFAEAGFPFLGAGVFSDCAPSAEAAGKAEVAAINSRRVMEEVAGDAVEI
jgi:hypothetical protein